MKRKLFSFLIVSLSLLPLTSCGCNHDFMYVGDSATCTHDGVKTYQCLNCGETKTEPSYATGHNWSQTKTTASCTTSGLNYFECTKCHETKTENQSAFGHSYGYDDTCSRCDEYKYDISWSQTEKYAGQILYCSFASSGSSVKATLGILMSKSGRTVWVSWNLKDKNGNKLGSGMPSFYWSSSFFDYSLTICSKSSLDLNGSYVLEISNIGVLN